MIISIIGGSGSGKDTQAAYIAEDYGIKHISMGEIMRQAKKDGDELAIEAMRIADQGKWVPDQITSQILENYVVEHCPNGFVITGYPRPVEQIESFDRIAEALGLNIAAVIHIEVPDAVLLERMQRQAAETSGDRDDTDPEIMQARLRSYHNSIDPLVREYRNRGLLIEVDGTPSRESVRRGISRQLQMKLGDAR